MAVFSFKTDQPPPPELDIQDWINDASCSDKNLSVLELVRLVLMVLRNDDYIICIIRVEDTKKTN